MPSPILSCAVQPVGNVAVGLQLAAPGVPHGTALSICGSITSWLGCWLWAWPQPFSLLFG